MSHGSCRSSHAASSSKAISERGPEVDEVVDSLDAAIHIFTSLAYPSSARRIALIRHAEALRELRRRLMGP